MDYLLFSFFPRAIQFKDQNDVWIEVWNEPYRYDLTDGYTDAIWLQNMNELTAIIRATGNKNIIVTQRHPKYREQYGL